MPQPYRAPSKDPNETLDYWIDYNAEDGDTIVDATWIVPTGLTEVSQNFTDTKATVFVSGGVVGDDYLLQGRIVTDAGRTIDRSFKIYCEVH